MTTVRKISSTAPDAEIIRLAASVLRSGGVILSPTDTIYGFSCSPFVPDALERIFNLKKRPTAKGFLVLISSLEQAAQLTDVRPPEFMELARHCWPGPLTMLLKGKPGLPSLLLGEAGKIGCRWPRSILLQALLEEFNSPIVSTSANLSGYAPPTTVASLRETFANGVDLFLDAGDCECGSPSTVVDVTVRPPLIVREGAGLGAVRDQLARLH